VQVHDVCGKPPCGESHLRSFSSCPNARFYFVEFQPRFSAWFLCCFVRALRVFYFILSGVVGDRRTGDYRSSLLVPPYLYGSVSVKQKKLPSNTKKIYSSACCG